MRKLFIGGATAVLLIGGGFIALQIRYHHTLGYRMKRMVSEVRIDNYSRTAVKVLNYEADAYFVGEKVDDLLSVVSIPGTLLTKPENSAYGDNIILGEDENATSGCRFLVIQREPPFASFADFWNLDAKQLALVETGEDLEIEVSVTCGSG